MTRNAWHHVSLRFLGPRRVEFMSTYSFESVSVPSGYVSDGATIPQALWWLPFIGHPFMGDVIHCAGLHDAAITERQTLTSGAAHALFYRALRHNNVGRVRAKLLYWGALIGGPRW